jgi:hypothetical protein
MALDPLTAVLDIGSKVIDRLWPDKAQADAAKLELFKMQQSGELAQLAADTELAKSQMAVNAEEAKSTNWFVAGWRPGIGWVCGAGLAYASLIEPLARFIAKVWFGYTGEFPAINTDLTLQILIGMLGLTAARSAEKIKSAEGNR